MTAPAPTTPLVVAHRGASYWAPEETVPAYRLACALGAPVLEADLQRTRDGVLVCFHDDDLRRTTDVATVFPERAAATLDAFTLAELRRLDLGSWFCEERPDRARDSFRGLSIVTLDELLTLAESGQPAPCVYLETKRPEQYPGIEADLRRLLEARGWLDAPDRRVLLQTFSVDSLALLAEELPGPPRTLLLWHGPGHVEELSPAGVAPWLERAVRHGAAAVGVSFPTAANPGYGDFLAPWFLDLADARGLEVHAYTHAAREDDARVTGGRVAAVFTDRPELFGARPDPDADAREALARLGF